MKAPKPEQTTYELCPAGTHVARLYKIINLGTHEEEHQGEKSNKPKVRLYWELPNEIKEYEKEENGQKVTVKAPFAVSRELTFSMHEKANMRPLVEGMIGTSLTDDEAYDFDIEALIGMPCVLSVKHGTSKAGNNFALVASTSPLMKGMEAPAQVNESEVIDVNDLSDAMIDTMPKWLQEKMRESAEYKQRKEKTAEAVAASPAAVAVSAPAQDAPTPTPDDAGTINPADIPF